MSELMEPSEGVEVLFVNGPANGKHLVVPRSVIATGRYDYPVYNEPLLHRGPEYSYARYKRDGYAAPGARTMIFWFQGYGEA